MPFKRCSDSSAFTSTTQDSICIFLQDLNKAVNPGIEVHSVWLGVDQRLISEGVGVEGSRRILSDVESPEDECCIDEQRTDEQGE